MHALLLLAVGLGAAAFLLGWYRQTCIFWTAFGAWNVPSAWNSTLFRLFTWALSTACSLAFAGLIANWIAAEVNDWLGRFSFGILLVSRWMLSSMVAVSRAQAKLEKIENENATHAPNPEVDARPRVDTIKATELEQPESPSKFDLPSLQDRESFLDLMYELGAKAVYEPEDIYTWLTELGIACEKTQNGLVLFNKIQIVVHEPEFGTAGIWPTDIVSATIAYYGYDIHSRMSGRGFYHKDLIGQLAKKWGIQKEYP